MNSAQEKGELEMRIRYTFQLVWVFLTIASTSFAQRPQGLQYVSPEVHDDGSVTFRLHAPEAEAVSVKGDFPGSPAQLEKGEDGIWSATVGPLPPNLYGYYPDKCL